MADWDERYKKGEHARSEAHPLVLRVAKQFEAGRALNVACGVGRHALWLVEQGVELSAGDFNR